VKLIDRNAIQRLAESAAASPRLRVNWNLHPNLEDPVQRLLNAMQPGTYVRPHRHTEPARWELFAVLTGAAGVLTFDARGTVLEREEINADGAGRVVEIPGESWHALTVLRPGTVLFELKPGPYCPISDKDFAVWAPAEGDSSCARFEQWFQRAVPGEVPPGA
jgi:cupin fold WbuC family metalloprotein